MPYKTQKEAEKAGWSFESVADGTATYGPRGSLYVRAARSVDGHRVDFQGGDVAAVLGRINSYESYRLANTGAR